MAPTASPEFRRSHRHVSLRERHNLIHFVASLEDRPVGRAATLIAVGAARHHLVASQKGSENLHPPLKIDQGVFQLTVTLELGLKALEQLAMGWRGYCSLDLII